MAGGVAQVRIAAPSLTLTGSVPSPRWNGTLVTTMLGLKSRAPLISSALVVQQVLPDPPRHELRKNDGQVAARVVAVTAPPVRGIVQASSGLPAPPET